MHLLWMVEVSWMISGVGLGTMLRMHNQSEAALKHRIIRRRRFEVRYLFLG